MLARHPRKHATLATQASTNSTPFLKLVSDVPSQKYLNPQVSRTNNLVNSVFFYHPCSSRLASGIHPFIFHRVSYLKNTCWIFSDLYIPICVGKFFQFMLFTLLSIHFYSRSTPLLKTPGSNFLKSVSPKTEGVEEAMICSTISKFNQKKWRWLGTLVYLHFVWFVIFLNVMALQFCK